LGEPWDVNSVIQLPEIMRDPLVASKILAHQNRVIYAYLCCESGYVVGI
jgi:hypothetical protein